MPGHRRPRLFEAGPFLILPLMHIKEAQSLLEVDC